MFLRFGRTSLIFNKHSVFQFNKSVKNLLFLQRPAEVPIQYFSEREVTIEERIFIKTRQKVRRDKVDPERNGDHTKAEQIFREQFKSDRYVAALEWEDIEQSLLGLNTTSPISTSSYSHVTPNSNMAKGYSSISITPLTVSNVILAECSRMDRIQVLKSYVEYSQLMDKPLPNLQPLLRILLKINIKSDDEFVLKVAGRFLGAGCDSITQKQYWNAIQVIGRTKNWRQGWKLVQALPTQSKVEPNPGTLEANQTEVEFQTTSAPSDHSVEATTALAVRALDELDESTMWDILNSPFFLATSNPVRAPRAQSHRLREAAYARWFKHVIARARNKEEAMSMVEKFYKYLRTYNLQLSEELGDNIKTFYTRVSGYSAVNTKINHHTGACLNCGSTLKSSITTQEFGRLKKAVLDGIIKSMYLATTPEDHNKFIEMLKKQGKFDVVIDGLNIALFRLPNLAKIKPSGVASVNLFETVKHFHRHGKRVLLIHRSDIKRYPHYLALKELAHLHMLDSLTQDDSYFILAALNSGAGCSLVSNDLLNDHYNKLADISGDLGDLFDRWQLAHQIYVVGFDNVNNARYTGKPWLTFPPVHPVRSCQTGLHWHIPLIEEAVRKCLYSGPSARWMCVGPSQTDVGAERGAADRSSPCNESGATDRRSTFNEGRSTDRRSTPNEGRAADRRSTFKESRAAERRTTSNEGSAADRLSTFNEDRAADRHSTFKENRAAERRSTSNEGSAAGWVVDKRSTFLKGSAADRRSSSYEGGASDRRSTFNEGGAADRRSTFRESYRQIGKMRVCPEGPIRKRKKGSISDRKAAINKYLEKFESDRKSSD